MKCRHCETPLEHIFVDLGFAPPSNAYLTKEDLSKPEVYYPLRVLVCDQCWLVQTEDYAHAEDLFNNDYAYFSSTSSTWLEHSRRYSEMIVKRLGLNDKSFVVEVASNDGYLLRNFVAAKVPCLGVEPTASTAEVAEEQGIPVIRRFFNEDLAGEISAEYGKANLIIGNNVYAHVPDINGFTRAIASLLKPDGVVTLEFPHLLNLIEETQFDTIYHEHYSYLSLGSVRTIFGKFGLRVWDVEKIPTHGGSLRVYGCLMSSRFESSAKVQQVEQEEIESGLGRAEAYARFQKLVEEKAEAAARFFLDELKGSRFVAGYGAPAKANTLLNYCGIKPLLLPFVSDASTSKQGKFMPGSHIPIQTPQYLVEQSPDSIVIFPWNIAAEIRAELAPQVGHSTRFVSLLGPNAFE
ncbi:MAG: class I SAM-dependent methyltransferase [Actinomycetota bacterium]|nr:class I SAM-dependent methyltransferase [Actinomycetota bacterium]